MCFVVCAWEYPSVKPGEDPVEGGGASSRPVRRRRHEFNCDVSGSMV